MSYSTSADLAPYQVLAEEIFKRVFSGADPGELNQWILAQLGKLAAPMQTDSLLEWRASFDFYEQVIEKARLRAALPDRERRVLDFPWASWNKYIGELEGGMLMSIAGASGAGKTLYAENIAEHAARQGLHVVFVHLELNPRLMLHRRAARHTGLDYRTLYSGAPGQDKALKTARLQMEGWDGAVHYLHAPGWTSERILQALDHLRSQEMCDVVIIDYLEKIRLPKGYRDKWQAEADVVEEFKNFAEATDLAIILLSQIGKEKQGNLMPSERLTAAAIKGASEKYERGNVIVLFHSNIAADGTREPKVRVFIVKNTVGATAEVEQYADRAHYRVGDILPPTPPQPTLKQGELQ